MARNAGDGSHSLAEDIELPKNLFYNFIDLYYLF